MKCVRQRCQEAPGSVAAIASTRPGWASELGQLDAGEAACDQAADEREPGGAVFGGDDVEAQRLAEAVAVDADGVHDADVDDPAALAALDHQCVERHVRVGRSVQRPGAEVLDDPVK
jgi:hypothetical protein